MSIDNGFCRISQGKLKMVFGLSSFTQNSKLTTTPTRDNQQEITIKLKCQMKTEIFCSHEFKSSPCLDIQNSLLFLKNSELFCVNLVNE